MQCPECGFDIDELNESQPVCPRCGADPAGPSLEDPMDHSLVQDALADGPDIMRWGAERQLYQNPGNDLIH